jgi:hypothetical protein
MKKINGKIAFLIVMVSIAVGVLIYCGIEYQRGVDAQAWDLKNTTIDGKVVGHNPYR